MVKSFVQALCLMAAASAAVAMPYDYDEVSPFAAAQRSTEWPFSELIRESPFEFHQREEAAFAASRTLPPCATETPTGLGPAITPDTAANFSSYQPFAGNATLYGVSNSSFLVTVVNDNDAYVNNTNTYLGWINQAAYSPWNCQQACNALNASGVKCNSYNTCKSYQAIFPALPMGPPPPRENLSEERERDGARNRASGLFLNPRRPASKERANTETLPQDYLRSPSLTPSYDSSCPNPPSWTTIVCSLWKNKLTKNDGVNGGELRGKGFQVVVAGKST